jgi:hypothetical protein
MRLGHGLEKGLLRLKVSEKTLMVLIGLLSISNLLYKEPKMKRKLFLASLLLGLVAALGAQGKLAPSSSLPVPDGMVAANEYQFNTDVSSMSVGATLGTDEKLYLSIQAKTSGWVALGVGGSRMDGSRLFLAYDTGSKQVFNEQRGTGHSHRDLADAVVEKWSVKASNGTTTLELVLPASAAVVDGKLSLLFAYSGSTSYAMPHKARGSLSLSTGK